jgi:hypothetical protein
MNTNETETETAEEETFNLTNAKNEMQAWIYDDINKRNSKPILMIGGSSCSGTGTLSQILRNSNHFAIDPRKEAKYFKQHCLPHFTQKIEQSNAQWSHKLSHWLEFEFGNAFFWSIKAQQKIPFDDQFEINSDWAILPWNIHYKCHNDTAWENYISEIRYSSSDPIRYQIHPMSGADTASATKHSNNNSVSVSSDININLHNWQVR